MFGNVQPNRFRQSPFFVLNSLSREREVSSKVEQIGSARFEIVSSNALSKKIDAKRITSADVNQKSTGKAKSASVVKLLPYKFNGALDEPTQYGIVERIEPMPDQGGSFINDVYLVTTSSGEHLVLKLGNLNWKYRKTTNEISSISFLKENTSIKVPRIVKYVNQISVSPIGVEYILMHRMPGRAFNLIFDEIYSDKTIYIKILNDLADIVAELHSKSFGKMGNFEILDHTMCVVSPIEFPATVIDQPCATFSEYAYAWLLYYTNEMKRLSATDHPNRVHFLRLIPKLETLLKVEDFSCLNTQEDTFVYCHQDLVMKNILIHDNRVSAVLDWEWSGPALPEFEIKTGFDFLRTSEDKRLFEELMSIRGFPHFFRDPPEQRQIFYDLIGHLYSLVSCYEWIEGKVDHSAKFLDQKLEQRMVKNAEQFDVKAFSNAKADSCEEVLLKFEDLLANRI